MVAVAFTARVTRGLEWVAADEIADLPSVEFLRIVPAGVEFLLAGPVAAVSQLRIPESVTAADGAEVALPRDGAEVTLPRDGAEVTLQRDEHRLVHGRVTQPLAAALVRVASCDSGARIADPFCGRGVIAVEAALGVAGALVQASDLAATALTAARGNAERAGAVVRLEVADAVAPLWRNGELDAVVTSPPWRVRLHAGGAAADAFAPVWSEVRRALRPNGVLAVLADDHLKLAESVAGHLFVTHLVQRVPFAGGSGQLAVLSPSDVDPIRPRLRAWYQHAVETGLTARY